MNFQGHIKSSFIDYPDKISTVVFLGGCNFRCSYCHNSSLVNNQGDDISEEDILKFLEKRKKMIDGVCISGGEPTLYPDIYDFIIKVKKLGYLVKLDTNGTNPVLLKKLIDNNLLDYVAMDIKAPLNKYEEVTVKKVNIKDIVTSINIIKNSSIDYEFRSTVCSELLSKKDIIDIGKSLEGSKKYVVQNFRDGDEILCGKGNLTPHLIETLKEIHEVLNPMFKEFLIRYN